MKFKSFLFGAFTLLILFLALELLASNLYFRKQHPGQISAAWDRVNKSIPIPTYQRFDDDILLKNVNTEANPWTYYPGDDFTMRLHPFIDFTRVITRHGSEKLDYFGFRNDTDLYFSNERNYILVVITGGSEVAGYTHEKTIAQNLENILNSKVDNKQFKVLNLAMNSYAIANEINTYTHLAYQLKPDYVITHSGSNDISNSIQVPEKFKKLGLFYFKHIEKWWLPRLYHFAMMEYVPNLNPYRSFIVQSKNMKRKNFLVYKKGLDQVVDSYIRNVKKYKNIAESNQGKFIVGIQPAKHILELEEQIWITQPNREEVIHLLKDLYSELQQKARKQGFIVFNDLGEFEFADFVHTSESGSIKTAQVYSEKILQDFKE